MKICNVVIETCLLSLAMYLVKYNDIITPSNDSTNDKHSSFGLESVSTCKEARPVPCNIRYTNYHKNVIKFCPTRIWIFQRKSTSFQTLMWMFSPAPSTDVKGKSWSEIRRRMSILHMAQRLTQRRPSTVKAQRYLPSLFMPASTHFLSRQARHWFRCVLSTGTGSLSRFTDVLSVSTDRPLWK